MSSKLSEQVLCGGRCSDEGLMSPKLSEQVPPSTWPYLAKYRTEMDAGRMRSL